MAAEVKGDATSLEAAALTMFWHPSKQPAPAIQKATDNASDARMILIEEKSLIVLLSLNCVRVDVELTYGVGVKDLCQC